MCTALRKHTVLQGGTLCVKCIRQTGLQHGLVPRIQTYSAFAVAGNGSNTMELEATLLECALQPCLWC